MGNNKQTAVEWLEKICNDRGYHLMEDYFKQAKAMEREQIEEAYYSGTAQFANDARIDYPKTSEEYYNETYKGGSNE
jgi:hypothetical protein